VAGVATAAMVRDPSVPYFTDTSRIDRATRAAENRYLDAQWISERLFGQHLPTNLVMLGAAYQHGCLPLSADAIEEAIRLNGAGADENRTAFRWGRAAVIDPDAVAAALAPAAAPAPDLPAALRPVVAAAPAVLSELLERRAADLAGYQNTAYARRYLRRVDEVARTELERTGDPAVPVTTAFAAGLHKLMAYKDEYEVARLHLLAGPQAMQAEFGPVDATRVLLHPPVLKMLGLQRKISLGRATGPAFRLLRRGRHLRGTAFDPFGWTSMRRAERALVAEYDALVGAALEHLHPASAGLVTAMAALADDIRGYEDVKRRSIDRLHDRAAALAAQLDQVGAVDAARRHPLAG
jgi:indolepyruvate ferredoxin oxidoreductase